MNCQINHLLMVLMRQRALTKYIFMTLSGDEDGSPEPESAADGYRGS